MIILDILFHNMQCIWHILLQMLIGPWSCWRTTTPDSPSHRTNSSRQPQNVSSKYSKASSSRLYLVSRFNFSASGCTNVELSWHFIWQAQMNFQLWVYKAIPGFTQQVYMNCQLSYRKELFVIHYSHSCETESQVQEAFDSVHIELSTS